MIKCLSREGFSSYIYKKHCYAGLLPGGWLVELPVPETDVAGA